MYFTVIFAFIYVTNGHFCERFQRHTTLFNLERTSNHYSLLERQRTLPFTMSTKNTSTDTNDTENMTNILLEEGSSDVVPTKGPETPTGGPLGGPPSTMEGNVLLSPLRSENTPKTSQNTDFSKSITDSSE